MRIKAAPDFALLLARAERDKFKAQVEVLRLRARLRVALEHGAGGVAAAKVAPSAEVPRFVTAVESREFWRLFDVDSRLDSR
jgi:hypothetical protein